MNILEMINTWNYNSLLFIIDGCIHIQYIYQHTPHFTRISLEYICIYMYTVSMMCIYTHIYLNQFFNNCTSVYIYTYIQHIHHLGVHTPSTTMWNSLGAYDLTTHTCRTDTWNPCVCVSVCASACVCACVCVCSRRLSISLLTLSTSHTSVQCLQRACVCECIFTSSWHFRTSDLLPFCIVCMCKTDPCVSCTRRAQLSNTVSLYGISPSMIRLTFPTSSKDNSASAWIDVCINVYV